MSDEELRCKLGHRLWSAVESSIKRLPADHTQEGWQIVADTIDLMIDKAINASRLQQLGQIRKAGCADFNHRSQGFCRNCGFHREEH